MAVTESKSRTLTEHSRPDTAESVRTPDSAVLLRDAFSRVPVGMTLVDRGGKLLQANPALCAMLGYTEQELLALTSKRVGKPSEDPIRSLRPESNDSRKGTEQVYIHSDGHPLKLKPNRYTISDGKGSFYFLWEFDTVVETKHGRNGSSKAPPKLEAELGAEELLATAAHELRTLLSSILGFSSTMFGHWDDLSREERYEFLRRIERRGSQLSDLVDNLLTVHSLEDQPKPASHDFVSVAEVIKETINDLSEGGSGIEWSCPPDLKVMVDRDHLKRMVVNFLGNALKYGELPIVIKAEERDGWMHLEVRDRGKGVSAGLQPRLFEKFSREQAVNNGTGLGLWIAQGLARAHQGEVSYEANPGGGSCFSLRLPHPAPTRRRRNHAPCPEVPNRR